MADEPSSSLVTTGQLDWVALARTPVTFTLEAISRIAKAGVEITTVSVGSAICSNFSFGPEGQKELTDSLNSLQGKGAFNNALWFGFGIKSVPSMLSETEQGACCVALCAALSTAYSSFQVGKIWRELSKQANAPETLTPSIQQWSSLVSACSGVLAKSHFGHVFDHFYRLLVPGSHIPREPISPDTFTEALLVLAKLSKGSMASAVFIGNADCALLAAIAKVLLNLNVEILDQDHKLVFASDNKPAQATFIRHLERPGTPPSSSLVRKKAYIVTSGKEVIDYPLNDLFHPPTKWSTVFQDVFPEWKLFSDPSLASALGLLLQNSALATQKFSAAKATLKFTFIADDVKRRPILHPMRTMTDFIHRTQALFPELSAVFESPELSPVTVEKIDESLACISHVCGCNHCLGGKKAANNKQAMDCLRVIASTVVQVVELVSGLNIHPALCLDIGGMRALAKNIDGFTPRLQSDLKLSRQLPWSQRVLSPLRHIEEIMQLFTGNFSSSMDPGRAAARSVRGICAFQSLLVDVETAPDALMIEIIPGNIRYNHHHYNSIHDRSERLYDTTSTHSHDPDLATVLNSTQMFVEESDDPTKLIAFYRLNTGAGIDYDLSIAYTSIVVTQQLLLDVYTPKEEITPSHKVVFVPATQFLDVGNDQRHCYRWSYLRARWVEYDNNRQIYVLKVEVFAGQNPVHYRMASLHGEKYGAHALLKTCQCLTCVRQMACDLLAASRVKCERVSVLWRNMMVVMENGEWKLSKFDVKMEATASMPSVEESEEEVESEPSIHRVRRRLWKMRKAIAHWVAPEEEEQFLD